MLILLMVSSSMTWLDTKLNEMFCRFRRGCREFWVGEYLWYGLGKIQYVSVALFTDSLTLMLHFSPCFSHPLDFSCLVESLRTFWTNHTSTHACTEHTLCEQILSKICKIFFQQFNFWEWYTESTVSKLGMTITM